MNYIDNVFRALNNSSYYNTKNYMMFQEAVSDDDSSELTTAIADIIEKSKRPVVKINVSKGCYAKEFDSFLFGLPKYIEGEIPTMPDGNQMRFMAQINFADVQGLPDYPTSGILQIWMHVDKYKSFWDFKNGEEHKIIYIPNPASSKNNIDNVNIDKSIYVQQLADFPDFNDGNADKNYKMAFSNITEESVAGSDINIVRKYITNELNARGMDIDKYSKLFKDGQFKCDAWGTKIGGYPAFTQGGIPDFEVRNTLLLQIDSCDQFMWGDSGIANFFISHDDLVNKNFNNVEFYWDCC